jgi:hypothetical protein
VMWVLSWSTGPDRWCGCVTFELEVAGGCGGCCRGRVLSMLRMGRAAPKSGGVAGFSALRGG